jgi:hypothetical protein
MSVLTKTVAVAHKLRSKAPYRRFVDQDGAPLPGLVRTTPQAHKLRSKAPYRRFSK